MTHHECERGIKRKGRWRLGSSGCVDSQAPPPASLAGGKGNVQVGLVTKSTWTESLRIPRKDPRSTAVISGSVFLGTSPRTGFLERGSYHLPASEKACLCVPSGRADLSPGLDSRDSSNQDF